MTAPTIIHREWAGQTVACLATGPSLTREDCDALRDAGVKAIAINDAWRLAPWAHVLYSSDRLWWPHYKGVPEYRGRRYGLGSSPGKSNHFHAYPQISVLRNAGYDGLELRPDGLRNGRNSGYAAVNLAVHFGASRILLLGYNMGYPNGRAHFFGNHPPGLSQNESLYAGFRAVFETMVEPLRARGVVVLNCTRNSSLTTFPCVELQAALNAAVLSR